MIDSLIFGIHRLVMLAGAITPHGIGTPANAPAAPATAPAAGAAAGAYAAAAAEAPAGLFGGGGLMMAVIWGAAIIGFWFLLIRPQKRREKKLKELQTSIKPGDNIVTNGGMFGRVADVGTDCFVVEMGISGRTVKVPILKSDVLGVRDPILTPPPKEAE